MKNIFFLFVFFPSLCFANLVINEIAWMGTTVSPNDEWIELFNNSEKTIDLKDWKLVSKDGSPEINLEGFIQPQGFFLLERTDDATVPNIKADQIYTGSLKNTGEYLELINAKTIDQANFQNGWTHGDNETKQTMERNNGLWQTSKNPGGTPKSQNSTGFVQKKISKPSPQKPEIEKENLTASVVKQPIKEKDSRFTLLFSLALIFSLVLGTIVFLVNKQGKIYDKEDE